MKTEVEGEHINLSKAMFLKMFAYIFSVTALIEIIKKYSNFVGFPIFLNGVCINTVQVGNAKTGFAFKTDLAALFEGILLEICLLFFQLVAHIYFETIG